jgi:hypothetical protein
MEALEADIAQAVSKNGMPSFVKDRAADALTACRLAASAALACLADTAQAMSAAEQSHHAAKALPAALVRLEHAMQGYSIDAESSLLGIPRTVEYAIAAPPAADPDSKDNPAAMGDKPSFALTLDKYLDARSALTRKSHAPGDKSRAGMLDGFGQVFQILGRVKQLALEGKSTAEGDLVRAVQTLEDMLAKADEADQRLQAAERAVLT